MFFLGWKLNNQATKTQRCVRFPRHSVSGSILLWFEGLVVWKGYGSRVRLVLRAVLLFFRPTPYGFRQVVQHVSKHVAFGINWLIKSRKADAAVAAKVNWWRTHTKSYVLSRSLESKKPKTKHQETKQQNTKTKTHTHKKQTPTQTTKQWRDSDQCA